MLDSRPRKILLAVESAACDAALEFAAAEARSRRCSVHLMHVGHPTVAGSPGTDTLASLSGELRRLGRKLLDDAAAKLEPLLIDADDLTVSTELCHGAVVPTLVAESGHACLVVVQHRGMGADGATPVLSVTNGVAARAHAPVVAVPSLWGYDPERAPIITVGVEGSLVSGQVVGVAVDEAHRNGARVRLVHAVTGKRSAEADLTRGESWRLEAELAAEFADVLARRPDVPVEVLITQGSPAERLLEQADASTMLVVGRRHPRLPISSHLGPVARTVLRWSPVPVLVVDPVLPSGPVDRSADDLATAAIP